MMWHSLKSLDENLLYLKYLLKLMDILLYKTNLVTFRSDEFRPRTLKKFFRKQDVVPRAPNQKPVTSQLLIP